MSGDGEQSRTLARFLAETAGGRAKALDGQIRIESVDTLETVNVGRAARQDGEKAEDLFGRVRLARGYPEPALVGDLG